MEMNGTNIEWANSSWNPVTGCTKVSPGCINCYAERIAKRLKTMGQRNYINGFRVTTHGHKLYEPLKMRKPKLIFVNSMGDLFHRDVPVEFMQRVFDVMRKARQHRFMILTKRSKRLVELDPLIDWPENVWMGVSVENDDYVYRINDLRKTGAFIKLVLFEPLIGRIRTFDLFDMDWVIVGGESGPGARPMWEEWVISIKDQCLAAGIPFYFKQWGGVNRKKNGRLLQGEIWDQSPDLSKILRGRRPGSKSPQIPEQCLLFA